MHLSYAFETTWHRYLSFFPEVYRERVSDLEEELWPWRGMTIHLDRLPAPAAKLKLILVHGAGAYGRVIAPFGTGFDVEVVAPDLPGYGLSRAEGVVDYDDWVDCLADLVARERARDTRPIVLFGGSMGGMLAYSVAGRRDSGVDGVIASCLLDPRSPDGRAAISRHPTMSRMGLPLLRSGILDRVHVPIRWITHMSRMANDPRVGALCASDPLGGGGSVSLRWVRTFLDSRPSVEPEDFDACPLLLAHPGADQWTPLSVSLPFYERLRCEKSLVVLEGAGHCPVEAPALARLEEEMRRFLDRVAATSSRPRAASSPSPLRADA